MYECDVPIELPRAAAKPHSERVDAQQQPNALELAANGWIRHGEQLATLLVVVV